MIGKPCYKGGNKHNFQARYSVIERERSNTGRGVEYFGIDELRKFLTLTDKKYIKDVCTWCGKEIK